MHLIAITVNGEYGFLFEGEYPRTYTFVPQNCVTLDSDESFTIDKLAYAKTRWGTRNMRFNSTDLSGSRLFPDERKPITRSDAPGLGEFLGHLRRGYGRLFTEPSAVAPQTGN
jgi:hypothetical protein